MKFEKQLRKNLTDGVMAETKRNSEKIKKSDMHFVFVRVI